MSFAHIASSAGSGTPLPRQRYGRTTTASRLIQQRQRCHRRDTYCRNGGGTWRASPTLMALDHGPDTASLVSPPSKATAMVFIKAAKELPNKIRTRFTHHYHRHYLHNCEKPLSDTTRRYLHPNGCIYSRLYIDRHRFRVYQGLLIKKSLGVYIYTD